MMAYIERTNAEIVQAAERWVTRNPEKTSAKKFWEDIMTKHASVALFCHVVRSSAKVEGFDPVDWCDRQQQNCP